MTKKLEPITFKDVAEFVSRYRKTKEKDLVTVIAMDSECKTEKDKILRAIAKWNRRIRR